MNNLYKCLYFLSLIYLSIQDPSITNISEQEIYQIGERATLNCTVDEDKYAVTWSKVQDSGSVVLSLKESLTIQDPRYTIQAIKNPDNTIYSFSIDSLQATDSGTYICEIIVSFSQKISKTTNLLIKHPPYIPDSMITNPFTITEGTEGEISCQGEGYPKPTIQWRRENDAILPGGGNVFDGSILKFSKAHRYDRGIYYCIANNEIGEPAKKPIQIEVEFKPIVKATSPKVGQARKYAIELQCKVEGFPAPAVSWFRHEKQLQSSGNYRITTNAGSHDITDTTLRIAAVDESDYGEYTCKAENKLGNSKTRIILFAPRLPNIYFHALISSGADVVLNKYINLSTLMTIIFFHIH